MKKPDKSRRLRITVRDEETGEELARATGVETLVLLAAPNTLSDEQYYRILMGDMELGVQLLFDIVSEVSEGIGQGTLINLADALDDHVLLEVTEGLPPH